MEDDEKLRELVKTLVETFDNPEVRYVTFERSDDGWNMRRFTRVPTNATSPFTLPAIPENCDAVTNDR